MVAVRTLSAAPSVRCGDTSPTRSGAVSDRGHPEELISASLTGGWGSTSAPNWIASRRVRALPGLRTSFMEQRRLLGGMRREPAPAASHPGYSSGLVGRNRRGPLVAPPPRAVRGHRCGRSGSARARRDGRPRDPRGALNPVLVGGPATASPTASLVSPTPESTPPPAPTPTATLASTPAPPSRPRRLPRPSRRRPSRLPPTRPSIRDRSPSWS